MSDIIELAKKCGATTLTAPSEIAPYRVSFDSESVEAFAAEIRREQDKEIEQLNSALDAKITICGDERVHQLQAKLAMMSEALDKLVDVCVTQVGKDYNNVIHAAYLDGKHTITATEQEVSAWRREVEAKAIEECAPKLSMGEGRLALLRLAQQKRSEGK